LEDPDYKGSILFVKDFLDFEEFFNKKELALLPLDDKLKRFDCVFDAEKDKILTNITHKDYNILDYTFFS
jgi:hypothetical protein